MTPNHAGWTFAFRHLALPLAAFVILLAGCSSLPNLADLSNGPLGPAPPDPLTAVVPAAAGGPPPIAIGPQSASAASSQPRPAVPQSGASDDVTIVRFRTPMVLMYASALGNEGERVASATVEVPLRARSSTENAARVRILTPSGPRWIARDQIATDAPL